MNLPLKFEMPLTAASYCKVNFTSANEHSFSSGSAKLLNKIVFSIVAKDYSHRPIMKQGVFVGPLKSRLPLN